MGDGKAFTLGKKSKCQQGGQMGEELPKELIPAKRVCGAESGIAREGISGYGVAAWHRSGQHK